MKAYLRRQRQKEEQKILDQMMLDLKKQYEDRKRAEIEKLQEQLNKAKNERYC